MTKVGQYLINIAQPSSSHPEEKIISDIRYYDFVDTLLQDAVYVLKNGFHEKKKTTFDEYTQTWKYAIRGKTIDKEDIRVVVAVLEKIIIITVIRMD